jgi:hypothetical protein
VNAYLLHPTDDYYCRETNALRSFRQIDELVYELYGLTISEIALVEGRDI